MRDEVRKLVDLFNEQYKSAIAIANTDPNRYHLLRFGLKKGLVDGEGWLVDSELNIVAELTEIDPVCAVDLSNLHRSAARMFEVAAGLYHLQ